MKAKSIYPLLAALLIALPLVFAYDFSESLSDSATVTDSIAVYQPVSGSLSDSLTAADSISVSLGFSVSIRDAMHIYDSRNASCTYCQFTNGLPGQPSSSSGNKFASNENIAGNTTIAGYMTQGILPFGMLFVVGLVGLKIGLNGYGIIGLGIFTVLVMAWIGLIPQWTIILILAVTALVITHILSRMFGTEQQ